MSAAVTNIKRRNSDIDLARPLLTLPLINCNRRLGEMVRPKAKMSYRDYEENGASEGESYQGGDSEEDFSDAPPAKKKKASAKKKVKKSKKSKKKSKYTADSDEDDMIAEVTASPEKVMHIFSPSHGLWCCLDKNLSSRVNTV